jgi:hypothetical protein
MLTKLEELLSDLFVDKMPPLSETFKNNSAKFLPWIFIVFGVIGLLSMVSLLGLFTAASTLTVGTKGMLAVHSLSAFDLVLIYLISPVLQFLTILAGYWMLNKEYRGWQLALISTLLGFLINLLHFSFLGLLFSFLFAYLLFQIREYYSI